MEKGCRDALRRLARQAKNRLSRQNYFEGKGKYKVYNGGLVADYKLVQLSNKEDEKFYQRVKDILKEDIDTINPLGKLVDKCKLEQMSNNEREKYIITLADKYVKMKQRFEKEQEMEFVG